MACSPRVLAERIATDLFSNAFGDQGTRLEIKQATAPQSERSLGGWCYVAAVDRITVILEENSQPTKQKLNLSNHERNQSTQHHES